MRISKRIVSWYFTKKALPYWCILILDCIIVFVSGLFGIYFQIGGDHLAFTFWPHVWGLLISLIFYIIAFRVFHTYNGVLRYSSFVDLERVTAATAIGSLASYLVGLGVNYWVHGSILMPTLFVATLMFILTTLAMFVVRVTVKMTFDNYRITERTQRCFIYGVKEGGIALAKDIQSQNPRKYTLVGFVSPDGDFPSEYIMGVRIRLDSPNTVEHMKKAGAKVLLVSPLQTEHFRSRDSLINELINAGIKIMMMPAAEEWDGKSELNSHLREVEIEDLLPRDKIEVDMESIGRLLNCKRIMITGAAGSIGSEMVRQICVYKPAELILVDQAETPMHDIRRMMADKYNDIPNETIVVSITDKIQMEDIFDKHKPEYVFHAAAYKHVPMMENNPAQAVRNNIVGTRIIADLAVKYGTKKFVMISTDKAVNPTNVMGCSKRICEIYCQSLNAAIAAGNSGFETVDGKKPETQFVTTRFGNVLGSNGSVIPIFREQIKKGGPITVTHPDIIRYFMLIPEACRLVLEAGTMGKGGEIFVFDMGAPVKIADLAKRMIALSGANDVEIKYTGLRDGEKLYEEVLSETESTIPTDHPKIKIAKVRQYEYDTACRNEEELLQISYSQNDMEIVRKMKEIVPEFKSKSSKYGVLDN